MENQRYGFYGFFGMIAFIGLMLKLTGCASPASADSVAHAPATHVVAAPADHTVHVDPAPGILGLLDLPPGEYIADTSETYDKGTTTITVEDVHVTIY